MKSIRMTGWLRLAFYVAAIGMALGFWYFVIKAVFK